MIPKIHPAFKLNGRKLNHEGLMSVAYSYVKEGEDWAKEAGNFLLNWLDDFDMLTVETSGSTGLPQTIKLKKEHVINSAHNTGNYFNLPKECDALCCLPMNYIAGKMMMVRAIALGWQLDLVKPSSAPFNKLRKRYDFTALTNHQVLNSLDNIHKSKKILIGGGPIASNLPALLEHKHTKAYHTYGMTETSSHIAIRKIYPVYESMFTTMEGVKLSTDDRGCLIIDAPELTSEILITNDLAEISSDGRFSILGRIDDVINTGGVKVHPNEIEEKLSEQISRRFFVYGKADEELGQEVILLIEGVDEKISFDALDTFQTPKAVRYVKEFKETHTGKVDRKASIADLEV
jgi:O-succinylbenzoic acid--CoA ligase